MSTKRVSWGNFQYYRDYLQWISFCNKNYRQSTISEQILETFGQSQNCQNKTFKWLYQLKKAILEKCFFRKRFTMMLLYMYQIFSSLRSHLHLFVRLFFAFMEYFFCGHPILLSITGSAWTHPLSSETQIVGLIAWLHASNFPFQNTLSISCVDYSLFHNLQFDS